MVVEEVRTRLSCAVPTIYIYRLRDSSLIATLQLSFQSQPNSQTAGLGDGTVIQDFFLHRTLTFPHDGNKYYGNVLTCQS